MLLLLLACAKPTPPAAPPPAAGHPSEGEGTQPISALELHMSEHLEQAERARRSVIAGDLDQAREAMAWLAEHGSPEGFADYWHPGLADMRAVAAQGAQASSLTDAAIATAELGNACGACHQSLSVQPDMPYRPAPEDLEGLQAHMGVHAWAAERMWESLVTPSAEAWQRGAERLGDPVSHAEGLPEAQRELEAQLHALAQAALADDNPDTRADLYGQILESCGGCHVAARSGP
ncbi:MAG: hypothetical protein H6741_32205 [Alphaproteobacteria bacterium]|nr:hypothetical protein [Alphaproteobacteria bacterium]